jgi:hypothetical protein
MNATFSQLPPSVHQDGTTLYSYDRAAHLFLRGLMGALHDTYGLDEAQATELLQSKWLRHACDRWEDAGNPTHLVLAYLLKSAPNPSDYLEE